MPITLEILEEATALRAHLTSLKTPDAIRAATALHHTCSLFLTNDHSFLRVPNLSIGILDDLTDHQEV